MTVNKNTLLLSPLLFFLFPIKSKWGGDAPVEIKENKDNVQEDEFDILSLTLFLEDVTLFALFMFPRVSFFPF